MRTRRKPAQVGDTVRDTMLVFGAPTLAEAEIQEVVEALRSGWIGNTFVSVLSVSERIWHGGLVRL